MLMIGAVQDPEIFQSLEWVISIIIVCFAAKLTHPLKLIQLSFQILTIVISNPSRFYDYKTNFGYLTNNQLSKK